MFKKSACLSLSSLSSSLLLFSCIGMIVIQYPVTEKVNLKYKYKAERKYKMKQENLTMKIDKQINVCEHSKRYFRIGLRNADMRKER